MKGGAVVRLCYTRVQGGSHVKGRTMSFGSGYPGDPPVERESELRRRIAFYEGFDSIINENIRRSGELLRDAEQRHAAAIAAAASARDEQRRLLAGLAEEAGALARHAESLARRIDAAMEAVGSGSATPGIAAGSTALVIHGVPDVAAAQELQLSIARAVGTGGVSVREFSGGMLRLEVPGREDGDPAHLHELAASLNLEEIDRGPGVLAVRVRTERP